MLRVDEKLDPGGRSFAPPPGYDLRRLQRRIIAMFVEWNSGHTLPALGGTTESLRNMGETRLVA